MGKRFGNSGTARTHFPHLEIMEEHIKFFIPASGHFGLLLRKSLGLRFFKMTSARVHGKVPYLGSEVSIFGSGLFIDDLGIPGGFRGAQ